MCSIYTRVNALLGVHVHAGSATLFISRFHASVRADSGGGRSHSSDLAKLVAVVRLVDQDVCEEVVHQLRQRRVLGQIIAVLGRQLRGASEDRRLHTIESVNSAPALARRPAGISSSLKMAHPARRGTRRKRRTWSSMLKASIAARAPSRGQGDLRTRGLTPSKPAW